MASKSLGLIDWGLDEDQEDGHRDYFQTHLIETDDTDDGPYTVWDCPDLPLPGTFWAVGNDVDPWAFYNTGLQIKPAVSDPNERHDLWEVRVPYTTRPRRRCQDQSIENPLNEPPRISGSFVKFQTGARFNFDGTPIRNSGWQPIRGPSVEFDNNRPTIAISMNVPVLPWALVAQFMDSVNDAPLWGLPVRCVKLSNASFERYQYGTCNFYYTVNLEFDINYYTFDRTLLDEGNSILNPFGGDPNNPDDFEVLTDDKGKPKDPVILDGAGRPWLGPPDTPGQVLVKYYRQNNLLALGIPTTF